MANRLASATSPYLLQHAQNPVDWWEWEPAAFEEARRRDVPILLSVGYAACHWCHVMAHESFEDAATAAYMNEHFVSIKVDREERPDIDAVYMAATTAMTGQGGWPMTCVLDHEGTPFFAGTYFPAQPLRGMPAFTQVLQGLADAWAGRRDEVAGVAANIRAHLVSTSSNDADRSVDGTSDAGPTGLDVGVPASAVPGVDLAAAVESLAEQFDPHAGGFGTAPKFPPTMVLEFLRRMPPRQARGSGEARGAGEARGTGEAGDEPAQAGGTSAGARAAHMLNRTAAAMARGGMYDQLGGGFARYAVDRGWVVPHFEKMLYDNAQLLGLYARLGTDLGDRIARDTADFLLRDLGTPDGGLASALDADSEGVEGKFYVWTPEQLVEALGAERGEWAARVFEVTDAGTFEHGASTLQRRHDPPPEERNRLSEVRARLFDVRAERVPPARDDKVVAAWNGLAISGLCDAGLLLREPRYVEAAVGIARLLERVHLVARAGGPSRPGRTETRLLRVSRDGVAGRHDGVLEDYGCVASGLLSLVQATGDAHWLASATALLDAALAHFRAPGGGFFDTADDAEQLLTRPRDASDNPSPSGTSSMIHALVTAHALTGEGRYRRAAEEALAGLATLMQYAPRFAGWSLAAAVAMAEGPEEIAVVGPAGPDRDTLAYAARRRPGAVVVVGDDQPDGRQSEIPLLVGRTAVDGRPAAYVCRGFVCERPVTAL